MSFYSEFQWWVNKEAQYIIVNRMRLSITETFHIGFNRDEKRTFHIRTENGVIDNEDVDWVDLKRRYEEWEEMNKTIPIKDVKSYLTDNGVRL